MLTRQAKNMVRLGRGGSYGASKDALRHQIWDTRSFAATPQGATFFTQPIGSQWASGMNKTKNETNMLDSGKLPNGQTLLVTRIGLGFISGYNVGATDAAAWPNASLLAQAYVNILQSSSFEIKIAGRDFDFQIHGRQFLPAMCINGYNAGTAGSVARVGDTVVGGWVRLDPSPIFLDSLVSFSVVQNVENADTTNIYASSKPLNNSFAWMAYYYCRLQVCLEGFLTRSK